jgi:hypothetical protein
MEKTSVHHTVFKSDEDKELEKTQAPDSEFDTAVLAKFKELDLQINFMLGILNNRNKKIDELEQQNEFLANTLTGNMKRQRELEGRIGVLEGKRTHIRF